MATDVTQSARDRSPESSPTRPAGLRLWPAVVLVGLYWGFIFGYELVELSMFERFVSRFVALGLLLLCFLVWWLSNGRFTGKERLAALAALVLGGFVAALVGDPSAGKFLPIAAGPAVFTAWTLWLLAARIVCGSGVRLAGLCLSIWLVFGYYSLIRWEGLDGGQHSVFTWRWQPTAEQQFLAAHGAEKPPEAAEVENGAASPIVLGAGDWPEFRGPHRDNQLSGLDLARDWQTQAPRQLWRKRIGPAWSSMIVVGDRFFTQEQRGASEAVVAYDAATGDEIWVHADPVRFFENLSGNGPRATPTFADGRIFTFGGTGLLNCLDAADGRLVWSRDVAHDSGAELPQWGYSNSPLVVGNVVVTYAGGDGEQGVLAYGADSGEPLWQAPAGKNSYSSPQLVTIDGARQLVMSSESGTSALDPATGQVLWQLASTASGPATPVIQPQTVGDGRLLVQVGAALALVEVAREGQTWTRAKSGNRPRSSLRSTTWWCSTARCTVLTTAFFVASIWPRASGAGKGTLRPRSGTARGRSTAALGHRRRGRGRPVGRQSRAA